MQQASPILQAIQALFGKQQNYTSPLPQQKSGVKAPVPSSQLLDNNTRMQQGTGIDTTTRPSLMSQALQGISQTYNATLPQKSYHFDNPIQPHEKGNILNQALAMINPPKQQVLAADTNQVDSAQLPSGIDLAMKYIQDKSGGKDPMQYFKAFQDPDFLPKIQEADKIRPGLGNLLLLQAFNESTLGNAQNNNNIFGALPGGEGSGKHATFQTPSQAIDYQLGKNVLGGGANKNMNLLNENTPLTIGRVKQLYKSYNPSSDYLPGMIQALTSH